MNFRPGLNKIPVISTLLSIRDGIYSFWSWFAYNFHHLKIVALISLTLASIRCALGIFGYLFNALQNIISTSTSTGGTLSSAVAGESTLFDKVNAVFPVAETFAFMVAYAAVLFVTTGYMLVRAAYKNIPGKAT